MGFFDAVKSVGSAVSDVSDVVSAGANIYSGISGLFDDTADDAYAGQIRALRNAEDYQKRLNKIGDKSAGKLSKAFGRYLNDAGDTGFYDPTEIATLTNFFRSEFDQEFDQERQATRALMDEIRSVGGGLGIEGDYSSIAAGANQDVGAYQGNYDALVNDLSSEYLDTFTDNTNREVDRLYSMAEADSIRKGMDRSTYDVEMQKGAMQQAKSMRDQDVVKAIDRALQHVTQRQQQDATNQAMRSENLSGQLKKSGLGIEARQSEIMDKIRSLDTAKGLMGGAQGIRQNQYGLVPNRAYTAMGRGFKSFGNFSDARRSGLNELTYTIGKPFEMQSTGAQNAGQMANSTIQGWNNAYSQASANRAGTNEALGYGVNKLSEINWDNMF